MGNLEEKMQELQKAGYNSEVAESICNTDLDFELVEQTDENGEVSYLNCFPQYNLFGQQLVVDGKRVRKGFMLRDLENGGVFMVSKNYHAIAHQYLGKLVATVSDMLGIELTPVRQPAMSGRFYKANQFGQTISRDGNFLFSSYLTNNTTEVTSGSDVQSGITIVNTLDGSTAVHIVPYTYTIQCMNQMSHIMKSVTAHSMKHTEAEDDLLIANARLAYDNAPLSFQQLYPSFDDFRLKLHDGRFIHNKEHNEQRLAETIAVALQYSVGFVKDMTDMARIPVTQDFAETVVDGLSAGGAKLVKSLEVLDVEREKVTNKDGEEHWINNVKVVGRPTQYDLFSDLTRKMHTEPVSSSIKGHLNKNEKIQSLFPFGKQQQVAIV
jgi:hypothetical protein